MRKFQDIFKTRSDQLTVFFNLHDCTFKVLKRNLSKDLNWFSFKESFYI